MTGIQNRRQKVLRRKMLKRLFFNIIICMLIFASSLVGFNNTPKANEVEVIKEEYRIEEISIEPLVVEVEEEILEEHNPVYVFNDLGWQENDDYLLAKIAMAEAEGCSIETKCFVIATVLNRTRDNAFPDTIKEVIFEKKKGVYQFSPIGDGRWDRVKPNEECWKALKMVKAYQYDFSLGALYFESCKNADNWHSRNLEFLYKSDTMRFYK